MLFFCLEYSNPCKAHAQPATIDDYFVINSDTHLLLYLKTLNCFTKEMETGIQNGIPATFTYFVDLYQVRKNWPDKKLVSHTFHRTLAYDTLKEEYSIAFSESEKKITTSLLADAKEYMSEIHDFKITTTDRLSEEGLFVLKVKAKLARKTLPLYFHYLIPFSSLWDFETSWYSLQFRY